MKTSELKHLPPEYRAQLQAQLAEPVYPVRLFLPGLRVKNSNRISTIGAKIGNNRRMTKAFDEAGIGAVRLVKEKRIVIFTRWMGFNEKKMDEGDNLPWAFKKIRDELKHRGYIVDDSPAWILCEYRQGRGEKPGVEIEIV